ncbi:OmpA family protein [Telluribacter sp.]|jgi:outer membrane protein OmpA-like peptidoglycan-associated protein/tetratricopeptide (TPR) repeat protein|uniref:OmpA family protein n=1 Tax=Telluribacter sp. TaxID=1978767 RepID=UPI002E0E98CB|nr:OmpA family protein [Telluribacter sp.]
MTRFTNFLVFFLFLTGQALGQTLLGQADKEFESLAYLKATKLYEQALLNKELSGGESLAAKAKLGYSYRQLKDSQNAERIFGDLIREYDKSLPQEYNQCYLYYAQALASNGKYKVAQEIYGKYSALEEADNRAKNFSKLNTNVSLLTKNEASYRVNFLDINGSSADFSPAYFRDGLVFVSGRNEGVSIKRVFNWNETAFLDLYYLNDLARLKKRPTASLGGGTEQRRNQRRKKGGVLGRDAYTSTTANDSRTVGYYAGSSYNINLGYEENPLTESEQFSKTLNSKYHEGPATFFKDGNRVIFTRNNFSNGKYGKSQDGINKLKLFTAENINGSWTRIEELPLNGDDFSTGHPSLNADNTLLYFASDRPGGMGGTDIYVSRLENGTWSEPQNLGPEVNTKGNEMFPFVDERGGLYFSSDGWPGMGDLDIYYAVMEQPVKPRKSINLGAPINSSKDDFGILTDGDRSQGYFSSNRRNGGSDDDIYSFEREGPLYACRDLTVQVLDAVSRQPLKGALVQIENKHNAAKMRQVRTDSTGALSLCMEAENEFMFIASSTGYLNNSIGFAVRAFDDVQPSRLEIPLIRATGSGSATAGSVMMKGKVVSNKNQPLQGVLVTRRDDMDGTIQETETGADGTYTFDAVPGRNYTIDATIGEFGTFGKKILNFSPDKLTEINILMFEKGDVMQVENIYYDLDKWELRPDAQQELDKVVEIMQKYPEMKIELSSHTDSRANSKYNKALSNSRARAAKHYIVGKGIAAKRIATRGYGESRPVNKCTDGVNCPDEEHQQNRRTEIRIVNLN